MHKIAKKITQIGLTGLVGLSATFVALAPNAATAVSLRAASNLGLVGYWTFDEGTGLRANDFSGKNNYGTLSGTTKPTWVSGKHGKALSFDGSSGYVKSTITNGLSGSFTMSAWVKLNTTANDKAVLASNVSSYSNYWAELAQSVSNRWVAYLYDGTNNPVVGSAVNTLQVGVWTHIVFVRDVSQDKLLLYLDGQSAATPVTDTTTSVPVYSEFDVGWTQAHGFTNGLIDDVRIYNRALSATEVYNLYKSGSQVVNKIQPVRLNQGLVGYWSFDGNTMYNNVADLSGNGNHGLLQPTNATSSMKTVGKIGQGLRFDGSTSYVDSRNNPSVQITGALTMASWVNIKAFPTNTVATWKTILSKGNIFGNPDVVGYGLGLYSSGGVQYLSASFGSNGLTSMSVAVAQSASGINQVNQWYYVVATWDGTTNTNGMKVFVNGVLNGQGTASVTNLTDKGYNLALGKNAAGASYFFNGLIDDVRIYNRALNPSEIKALYKMGQATINKTPVNRLNQGLVGYWTFDGPKTVSNIADSSGAGNHGLLQPTNATSSMKVAGKIGQGLRFNGSNNYINVDSGNFGNLDIKSVFAWVQPSGTHAGTIRSYVAGTRTGNDGWWIRQEAGNYLFTCVGGGVTVTVGTLPKDKWSYIGCIYNGTQITPYLNGVTGSGNTYVHTNGVNLKIGTNSNSVNEAFTGLIDDVRIYNRALSASEVKSLYNMGR